MLGPSGIKSSPSSKFILINAFEVDKGLKARGRVGHLAWIGDREAVVCRARATRLK